MIFLHFSIHCRGHVSNIKQWLEHGHDYFLTHYKMAKDI